jgi:hypothetical protein
MKGDIGAVLCFATPGDRHHENAATGRLGDRYFPVFLLFDHHCYEHHVRARFGAAKILNPLKLLCTSLVNATRGFDNNDATSKSGSQE